MDLSAHEVEIPIPMSTNTYVNQSQSHSIMNEAIHEDHNQNHISASNKKGAILVRYRECLKNHAASIGGNATDGCGEFMPSGEDGTLEALKCSACNCHRNFHRKEIEGEPNSSFSCRKQLINGTHKGGLLMNSSSSLMIQRPMPQNMMILPLQTSESDEMLYPRPPFVKKRFRTKFSAEQKEKMLAFAERVGWKLQKQEESVVQQLCQEIGVKRRVLKVWMHNNKHNFAKKPPMQSSSLSDQKMN